MSILCGICEHGKVLAMAIEDAVMADFLDEMAAYYRLERRSDGTTFDKCDPCQERYEANKRLLRTPEAK